MRLLLISAAALLASTAMANAEGFTFTGQNKQLNQVAGMGPMGKPIAGGVSSFENVTTMASGKKTSPKGTCAAWTAPPGTAASVNGVCQGTDETGTFSLFFVCANQTEKTANCWGQLTGTSGAYKGKGGIASWRGEQGADGKSSTSNGSGQWY